MTSRQLTMGPALLFVPADRPERFSKAAERSDAVIIDLEDAVAADAKQAARENIINHRLDPEKTIIRINPLGTAEAEKDLLAVSQAGYSTVMVAKSEDAQAFDALPYDVIALCETATGVLAALEIANRPNVAGLMWGAEDLIASLGGTSSRFPDGSYRAVALAARSQVLLAAGAAGKVAIDSIYADIPDVGGLALEVEDAVASGFGAKACIHPSQVQVIRNGYRPSQAELAAARELLAAAANAGTGVFSHHGQMVDGPILKHAEQTIRRAGEQP